MARDSFPICSQYTKVGREKLQHKCNYTGYFNFTKVHLIFFVGLIPTMLEVMKPQIAAGSKGVPTAYGEVLFRAWKDTAAGAGGAKNNGINTSDVSYAIDWWSH
jgi:Condensin II non structural maintenance of chromosomes subunit